MAPVWQSTTLQGIPAALQGHGNQVGFPHSKHIPIKTGAKSSQSCKEQPQVLLPEKNIISPLKVSGHALEELTFLLQTNPL